MDPFARGGICRVWNTTDPRRLDIETIDIQLAVRRKYNVRKTAEQIKSLQNKTYCKIIRELC